MSGGVVCVCIVKQGRPCNFQQALYRESRTYPNLTPTIDGRFSAFVTLLVCPLTWILTTVLTDCIHHRSCLPDQAPAEVNDIVEMNTLQGCQQKCRDNCLNTRLDEIMKCTYRRYEDYGSMFATWITLYSAGHKSQAHFWISEYYAHGYDHYRSGRCW